MCIPITSSCKHFAKESWPLENLCLHKLSVKFFKARHIFILGTVPKDEKSRVVKTKYLLCSVGMVIVLVLGDAELFNASAQN